MFCTARASASGLSKSRQAPEEVKFDGWRAQLHREPDRAVVYSRNGRDITSRFRQIRDSVLELPVRTAVIDAEVVVCDDDGKPDFRAIMAGQQSNLCAWCFDLMELDGHDLRTEPLDSRRERLRQLLIAVDDHVLRLSEDFPDPVKLLEATTRMGLEGIVSKKRDQPYRSGKNAGWVKVKTVQWREANRDRWEMFQPLTRR